MNELKVDDRVEWRYFNTPENKFYGPYYTGTIVEIDHEHYEGKSLRPFCVSRPTLLPVWLSRKEIKRVLK